MICRQKSADLTWWFGDAGLDLAPHGLVHGNPIWHNWVWHFICESWSHIFTCQI